jgi:hypothetical protein
MVWRAYFNKHNSEHPWSIDKGDQTTEINVRSIRTVGCNTVWHYNGGEAGEDVPVAWVEIEAKTLQFNHLRVAVFYGN